MLRKISTFLLCVFLHIFGVHVYAADSLYGKWVGTESTKGDLRSALTITKSGELISTIIVMLDFNFSISKGNVLLEGGDVKKEYEFTIDNDEMKLSNPEQNQKISLSRVYKHPEVKENSILGHWFFIHDTGGEAYYLFQNNGRGQFIVLMPGETINRIKIDGNKMSVKNPSREVESVITWEIIKGQLIITRDEERSWSYKPVRENVPIRPNKRLQIDAAPPRD